MKKNLILQKIMEMSIIDLEGLKIGIVLMREMLKE